jgi:hypothetical protein
MPRDQGRAIRAEGQLFDRRPAPTQQDTRAAGVQIPESQLGDVSQPAPADGKVASVWGKGEGSDRITMLQCHDLRR